MQVIHKFREIVAAGLFFLTIVCTAGAQYGGGSGTKDNPYQIWTAEQMNAIGATPADLYRHFKLMASIDLSPFDGKEGRQAFNVIGSFDGSFDGAGHTISHLTIAGGGRLGLFGQLQREAEIMNLGIVDVNVIGSNDYIGALAGTNGGALTACFSTGVLRGREDVGGLVGDNRGTVRNCYSTCAVSGGNGVGGLMGENSSGTVSNCYSTGAVRGTGWAGGLTPYNQGTVTHCFWDIQTSGQAKSAAGAGKTTVEMQTAGTFLEAGWDFVGETANGTEDMWKISDGLAYPRLWWEKYGGGTGEPNDPYLIYTAEQLGAIGAEPNDWDKHFRLMADIDLSGYSYDRAVIAPDADPCDPAFTGTPFTGVFDGNGRTLSHLTIQGGGYLGLFGQTESAAVVENLGLPDVNIAGTDYVGGLAGFNRGRIAISYVTGTISGENRVGGLTGRNWGNIAASYNVAEVTGNDDVGGLAAANYGSITNSYNTGPVAANRDIGGLVGENYRSIAASYSTGEVSGETRAGGLVGYNWPDTGIVSGFYDMETSGLSVSDGGIGKTTVEMQTAGTFLEAGWDFVGETVNGADDIWRIEEGEDYPRLAWEPQETQRLPVIELDAASFDAQIAEGVILVDFYATWCPHCAEQAPILEQVADRLQGRARVAKLDIDKARSISQKYGVSAVPTLIVFQKGVVAARFVGVTSADVLVSAILAAVESL